MTTSGKSSGTIRRRPMCSSSDFPQSFIAFELVGAGPRFLQDLDPLDDCDDKAIGALLIDAPGAQTLRNNADLFVKRGGRARSCPEPRLPWRSSTLSSYAHVRRRWPPYFPSRRRAP